jgi:hypothetical protein
MVTMPQPTVQYVQLGQTPNMAHPVIQYNGKNTFCKLNLFFYRPYEFNSINLACHIINQKCF